MEGLFDKRILQIASKEAMWQPWVEEPSKTHDEGIPEDPASPAA